MICFLFSVCLYAGLLGQIFISWTTPASLWKRPFDHSGWWLVLMCSWIQFVSILLSIFTSLYIGKLVWNSLFLVVYDCVNLDILYRALVRLVKGLSSFFIFFPRTSWFHWYFMIIPFVTILFISALVWLFLLSPIPLKCIFFFVF